MQNTPVFPGLSCPVGTLALVPQATNGHNRNRPKSRCSHYGINSPVTSFLWHLAWAETAEANRKALTKAKTTGEAKKMKIPVYSRCFWLLTAVNVTWIAAADQNRNTCCAQDAAPEPRTEYKGRLIAETMHYEGASWLIRDEREREERCSMLLANLGLKPGQVVCDMGCGNGFHTLQIAEMIGENGRVIAVDVQPEMLALLRNRMEDKGLRNITPVLGSYHDPCLPDASCDLILLVDVYHEFSYPELMLAAMRKALKPEGRIALVEFRLEDPDVPIKKLHKMSKKQILKEYLPNRFRLADEFDALPWQHLMFFEKDE